MLTKFASRGSWIGCCGRDFVTIHRVQASPTEVPCGQSSDKLRKYCWRLCAKSGETNCPAQRARIFRTTHKLLAGHGVHYKRAATGDAELSTTSQASSQQQLFYLIYFKNKTKSFEEIVMGVESWKSVRLVRHFATFGEEQEALFPSISTVLDTR
jgi:hypothetical protein